MATATTTATMVHPADFSLKRSHVPDLVNSSPFPSKKFEPTFPLGRSQELSTPSYWVARRSPRSSQPRRPSWTRLPSMVQATRPMPSFMSVFGEDINSPGVKYANPNSVIRPSSSGNVTHASGPTNGPFSSFHVHRDSTSTLASESSDSSPTTTISTMDSSSATEISPGPSPESPSARIAPTSFEADFRSRRSETAPSDHSPSTFFELQRPVTPAKKPRNIKSLGINTSSSLGNLRSNQNASLPSLVKKEKNTSAPTSPSFIKPPTPPKRRPSNLSLTIQTPGSDNKPMRLIIPSTPSLNRPALRHFQSSPSLPLCSPGVAPSGGMQFPALRPIKTNPQGFAEVPMEMEEDDQEPNFDIPQSREEKPAAYPNGPICIYESGVYLYFEPTAQQAATFDVIVNVASEVKNPFGSDAPSQKDLDARRVDGPPAETVDFATLPERSQATTSDAQSGSPTTPKATPLIKSAQSVEQVVNGAKTEYIHIPWEHNTDIVPDLYNLVKMMDERVQQHKRVLVHCQCGVSRSASLVVAYGIYKNPGISVQEAYDAVKKRSKWIGPNMNLIMQLQEFRNGLLRANESRHNQTFGHPRRSAGLSTGISGGTNRHSPFDREAASGPRTPRTAPLPPDTDMSMQRASTGNMISISPGPLSAPSAPMFSPGFRRSWASSQTHFDLSPRSPATKSATSFVDPKGHVLPVLSITHNDEPPKQSGARANGDHVASEQREDLKALPVPNFSRQLPFRANSEHESSELVQSEVAAPANRSLTAPSQSTSFAPLLSPAASSFSIPALGQDAHTNDVGPLFSPKTEFNTRLWPQAGDLDSPPGLDQVETYDHESLMSPRSAEFHMTALNHGEIDDSYGLLSPRATSFDPGHSPVQDLCPTSVDRLSDSLEVTSPNTIERERESFHPSSGTMDTELMSPRAAEFHMTPLQPRAADEDPFGLTSPRHFEFPNSLYERVADLPLSGSSASHTRRPSFQAFSPPSHLEQPEAINGFTSLNSTAQSYPAIPMTSPFPVTEHSKSLDIRVDSLSASPEPDSIVNEETPILEFPTHEDAPPPVPAKNPERLLTTPPRQTIRTRFSSPNMREQRRLHKLQTEMEAMLPQRTPPPLQSMDDLDALMSPRAEEFTRNPFHFDLHSSVDDTSPASSTDTIKNDSNHSAWKDASYITPPKAIEEDPRSPVQTGSSPIVRNIWDVL